jgi:energy-coupling factor transporter ATP-binding protein EcfA2
MVISQAHIPFESDVYNPLHISRIVVDKLFGYYSYDLQSSETDLSKLLILYGDNGSGKTTILKCIFHLLSPATNKRHRTELARIPFKRFAVTLGNKVTIAAVRHEVIVGAFEMSIVGPAIDVKAHFATDAALKLIPERKERSRRPLLKALAELDLKLHLLSDDRKIVTDLVSTEGEQEEDEEEPTLLMATTWNAVRYLNREQDAPSSLEQAIRRLVDWIRKQAITGSGTGETNANTVYADITKRIVSPFEQIGTRAEVDLNELSVEIRDLAGRSSSFARFGLSTEIPADDLISALKSSRAIEHGQLLTQVLRPFVDGVRLRLDALESIYRTISVFVDTVNAFYQGKVLSFHLREGITIRTLTHERLNPNLLSSGEKQLLLLLSNVLAAGDQASVFIIDEPEISLNIKWQRKLVDALLQCTRNSRTQFLLATHSLELLTQHQHHVLQLSALVHA